MKYYIIQQEIVTQYQGFQKGNFAINFTQTNTGIWAINLGCGEEIFTEIDWNSFDQTDLEIEDFQPDTNTPTYSPYYVEIHETMLFVFPQDKFIVNDFIVELTVNNNKRYVNTSYLEWFSFKQELDAPQNAPLKRSLEYVWDFVRLQVNTILPYLQDPQNNTLSPYILIIQ